MILRRSRGGGEAFFRGVRKNVSGFPRAAASDATSGRAAARIASLAPPQTYGRVRSSVEIALRARSAPARRAVGQARARCRPPRRAPQRMTRSARPTARRWFPSWRAPPPAVTSARWDPSPWSAIPDDSNRPCVSPTRHPAPDAACAFASSPTSLPWSGACEKTTRPAGPEPQPPRSCVSARGRWSWSRASRSREPGRATWETRRRSARSGRCARSGWSCSSASRLRRSSPPRP